MPFFVRLIERVIKARATNLALSGSNENGGEELGFNDQTIEFGQHLFNTRALLIRPRFQKIIQTRSQRQVGLTRPSPRRKAVRTEGFIEGPKLNYIPRAQLAS